MLYKVWLHLNDKNIDVSQIVKSDTLMGAIVLGEQLAKDLGATLKVVDNIHSLDFVQNRPKPRFNRY